MRAAKKRADFFEEGRVSARRGCTRSVGNEYRMPVFGEGTSWQARAFAAGFRFECKALGRKVEGDHETV